MPVTEHQVSKKELSDDSRGKSLTKGRVSTIINQKPWLTLPMPIYLWKSVNVKECKGVIPILR